MVAILVEINTLSDEKPSTGQSIIDAYETRSEDEHCHFVPRKPKIDEIHLPYDYGT